MEKNYKKVVVGEVEPPTHNQEGYALTSLESLVVDCNPVKLS